MTEKKNKPDTFRVRRVGTASCGAAFMFAGAVWLLYLLWPAFNVQKAVAFAPGILVLLGLEFLSLGLGKEVRSVRYDIFSILMCFVLVGISLGLAALTVIAEQL